MSYSENLPAANLVILFLVTSVPSNSYYIAINTAPRLICSKQI